MNDVAEQDIYGNCTEPGLVMNMPTEVLNPPSIGIIMLDTSFPRIVGDIGNPASFDFPVTYRVVPGARVGRVVHGGRVDPDLLLPFVEAARSLQDEGVRGIATSCGFLSVFQDRLAAAVQVPVVTSSLLLLPLLRSMLGQHRPIGVVVANKSSFTSDQLQAAGVENDERIIIAGMENCEAFARTVLATTPEPVLNSAAIARDLVAECEALARRTPDLGAILLECTNLVPYAAAVRDSTKLPVFSIHTGMQLLHDCTMPRRFLHRTPDSP